MTKLFGGSTTTSVKYSAEEFVNYYSKANVVSTEAISDYLYAIKDKVNALSDAGFSDSDTSMLDATNNRLQTLSVLKRVHFTDIAQEIVTTPERFYGNYVEYLKTLTGVSKEAVPEVIQLLNNLKMAVSGFINEYSEDGMLTVYGKSYADASAKLLDKQKEKISKFFPTNKSNSSSRVKDVISKNGDVETLFNDAKLLDANISHNKLKEVVKLSKEVSEMVDALIEQNAKSGILLKNDAAKRDLIEMIHVGATGVEFISYLYANAVHFYNSLKSLSGVVLVVGKR